MRWNDGTEDQSRGWSEAEKISTERPDRRDPGPEQTVRGMLAGVCASSAERPAPAKRMSFEESVSTVSTRPSTPKSKVWLFARLTYLIPAAFKAEILAGC